MNEILDTKTNLALPDALENFHELSSKLDGRSPMLFLDYDGTLTPIVSNPEDAVLSADTKAIIQDLTQAIPVAIISGRDRKNIESIFDHPDLFYAGSHGYDITGPNGLQKQHEQGPELLPSLDEAERNLKVSLARIPGVLVERKKYAIAVHYRNVEKAHVQQVKTTVAEEVGKHPKLKKGKGKKS